MSCVLRPSAGAVSDTYGPSVSTVKVWTVAEAGVGAAVVLLGARGVGALDQAGGVDGPAAGGGVVVRVSTGVPVAVDPL